VAKTYSETEQILRTSGLKTDDEVHRMLKREDKAGLRVTIGDSGEGEVSIQSTETSSQGKSDGGMGVLRQRRRRLESTNNLEMAN